MTFLGSFFICLFVQDIKTSKVFYEKLSFTQCGGDQTQNWLVMRNSLAKIALLQGHIEKNMQVLTSRTIKPFQTYF
jgi:predicted lactoylglutathione lyase